MSPRPTGEHINAHHEAAHAVAAATFGFTFGPVTVVPNADSAGHCDIKSPDDPTPLERCNLAIACMVGSLAGHRVGGPRGREAGDYRLAEEYLLDTMTVDHAEDLAREWLNHHWSEV